VKRGLVIGKFMPLHAGHIALINFAKEQCDEVIVSMSYTGADPIPFQKRFDWLKETFQHESKILPRLIEDNFDNPELPIDERTKQWAGVISIVYPEIDLIISSEEYGEPFAKNLGASHVSFDPPRTKNPVSASLIRQHPFKYWEYIPQAVRPYFVKKICFYGAESTGKSTMAIRMAEKYNTVFVPEVAREMLTDNNFTANDIIDIGHAHFNRILEAEKIANKILFCDTDAITTAIYSKYYLNVVPEVIFELEEKMKYDRYFLLDIDVPWVSDGLRDLGDKRKEIHEIFKNALIQRNIPFVNVSGSWKEREKIVSVEIDKLLADL
jgi:HTH-type transcriptional regulator, transcriptional repressor of NAD biosynthesis genes